MIYRFSPRFISSSIGWDATEKPPPRQDFALFMTFSIVGSSDTFQVEEKKGFILGNLSVGCC